MWLYCPSVYFSIVSLFHCLYVSKDLGLSHCLRVSVCGPVSLSHWLSLYVSSVCLIASVCLSLCIPVYFTVCFFVCRSLSALMRLSVSLCIPVYLTACLFVCRSLSASVLPPFSSQSATLNKHLIWLFIPSPSVNFLLSSLPSIPLDFHLILTLSFPFLSSVHPSITSIPSLTTSHSLTLSPSLPLPFPSSFTWNPLN